jgi:shikimate dehydrogenase
MEKYVLIGHPLGHSMSPFIHDMLFKIAGREADYKCVDIAPEKLSDEIAEINKLSGYNITIPHKVSVIPFLDELDETAQRYGAVNCVENRNGKLIGYNTDCTGFVRSAQGLNLSGKVLLLGCGGVGRMIAIEAVLKGAELTMAIIPEAKEMADSLIAEIKSKVPSADVRCIMMNEISGKYDLLINATPVGMYPKSDACPVSDEIIKQCGGVFDVIYNPIKTQLVKKAEAMGIKAVGGIAMLVLQAVKAHEIWNGDFYTDEQINEIIEKSSEKVEADFR